MTRIKIVKLVRTRQCHCVCLSTFTRLLLLYSFHSSWQVSNSLKLNGFSHREVTTRWTLCPVSESDQVIWIKHFQIISSIQLVFVEYVAIYVMKQRLMKSSHRSGLPSTDANWQKWFIWVLVKMGLKPWLVGNTAYLQKQIQKKKYIFILMHSHPVNNVIVWQPQNKTLL